MKKMKSPQKGMTMEQQKIANDLKGKTKEEQAQILVDKCNELGINKQQLILLANIFK